MDLSQFCWTKILPLSLPSWLYGISFLVVVAVLVVISCYLFYDKGTKCATFLGVLCGVFAGSIIVSVLVGHTIFERTSESTIQQKFEENNLQVINDCGDWDSQQPILQIVRYINGGDRDTKVINFYANDTVTNNIVSVRAFIDKDKYGTFYVNRMNNFEILNLE